MPPGGHRAPPPLALSLLLSLAALAGAAPAPAEIADRLNAVRAANGLPAVTVDPEWSRGCAEHNAYMRTAGVGHHQDAAAPGASPAGADAGLHGVLSNRPDAATAFAGSVFHELLLWHPALRAVGPAENDGHVCVRLDDLGAALPAGAVATYPGAGAAGVLPSADIAHEIPESPADILGIDAVYVGQPLLVWTGGPWLRTPEVLGASLTGPDGPLALGAIDGRSPWVGDGQVVLVPHERYAPGTTSRAEILLGDGTRTVRHTWEFTTGDAGLADLDAERAAEEPPVRVTASAAVGGVGVLAAGIVGLARRRRRAR